MKVYKLTNTVNNKSFVSYTNKNNLIIEKIRCGNGLSQDIKKYSKNKFKIEYLKENCENKKEAYRIINKLVNTCEYNKFFKKKRKEKKQNKNKYDQSKRIEKNIEKRKEKYKKFEQEINIIYLDKRYYKVKNFCIHGNLFITKYIFDKIYNLNRKNSFYCEKCLKEFIKKYIPTNDDIKKNQKEFNELINNANSSQYQVEFNIKRFYPDIYKSIIEFTKEFPGASWQERTYLFKNDIKRPLCSFDECNKETFYIKTQKIFSLYCKKHSSSFNTSNQERELRNFIENNFDEKIDKNIKIENNEIDIFVSNLNLGFEFNGVYWHCDKFKQKNYHYNKWKFFKEKNIKIINIWEDDWNYKQDIVKSIILNSLNKIPNKINGRDSQIKIISNKKEFLEKNHLQGNCPSSINLGLYYNDELVSLMTFGKKRKILGQTTSHNEYELLRFCNKKFVNIRGGASKLFKYFVKKYNPEKIYSYANCDISDGNLYKVLGFKEIKHTGVNYWWAKDGIKYHRSNFMKHKLIEEGYDKNKSENEIMRERGFNKIYGTGNLKYEF